MSNSSCPGDSKNCEHHFHDEDPSYLDRANQVHPEDDVEAGKQTTSNNLDEHEALHQAQHQQQARDQAHFGFRTIVQNFTPSSVKPLHFILQMHV
jgi:hypothetical protein